MLLVTKTHHQRDEEQAPDTEHVGAISQVFPPPLQLIKKTLFTLPYRPNRFYTFKKRVTL